MIPQDPRCFIAPYGKYSVWSCDASDEQVINACKACSCARFYHKIAAGLNAELGTWGKLRAVSVKELQ